MNLEERPTICPQCGQSVIQPHDHASYCEECGWPDENRAEERPTPETDALDKVTEDDAEIETVFAFARRLERERNEAREREENLKATIAPVLDWYQPDEEDDRPLIDILRDIVADLQFHRTESQHYRAELAKHRGTTSTPPSLPLAPNSRL